MNTRLPRWRVIHVALLLTAISITGCTSASPRIADPPEGTVAANLSDGERVRDALVEFTQGTATSIFGEAGEVLVDRAEPCLPSKGTRFRYSVGVQMEAPSQELQDRVSELWERLGIRISPSTDNVHGTGTATKEPSQYIDLAVMSHFGARNEWPALYQIEGTSTCVPGDPTEYLNLTNE